MIEPTETSRLRVIRTTACAAATIARIAAFETIALRFCVVRNCGDRSEKTAPSTTRKASTPLTRSFSAIWPKLRCGTSTGTAVLSADTRQLPRIPGGRHHDRLLGRRGGVEIGDQLAFGNDQDAIADGEHLRQVR